MRTGLVIFIAIFIGFLCQPIAGRMTNRSALALGFVLIPLGFLVLLAGVWTQSLGLVLAGTGVEQRPPRLDLGIYANAMAHGLATSSDRQIMVIDGDGAALMHLGNLVSIRAQQANLIHILLDNQCYDSTGGQSTNSSQVSFHLLAESLGYRTFAEQRDQRKIKDVLATVVGKPGPHLIHIRIQAGSLNDLARPDIAPFAVARCFRSWISKQLLLKKISTPM